MALFTDLTGIRGGDRVTGAPFATRSAVWGCNGAAATAHPLASLIAIDALKAGGSAVDAAIAANVALGFLEPIACGIGGDAFALLWDPKARRGGGPQRLRPLAARAEPGGRTGARAEDGNIAQPRCRRRSRRRARSTAGGCCTSATASCRGPTCSRRPSRWPRPARRWRRRSPTTSPARTAPSPAAGSAIEETENFLKVWAPEGRTPAEGEIFANPGLARTLRLIAEGGRDAFYEGEIAETIERYFARIGGWLSQGGPGGAPRRVGDAGDDQLPRRRRLGPAAERPGPGDPADAEHAGAVRPRRHGLPLRRQACTTDRGQAARLRGPRPLLRRPGVREDPDRVADLQGLRRRARRADPPRPHPRRPPTPARRPARATPPTSAPPTPTA